MSVTVGPSKGQRYKPGGAPPRRGRGVRLPGLSGALHERPHPEQHPALVLGNANDVIQVSLGTSGTSDIPYVTLIHSFLLFDNSLAEKLKLLPIATTCQEDLQPLGHARPRVDGSDAPADRTGFHKGA